MRRIGWAVAVLLAGIPAGVAAHVAPAVKDNNRYIKVTPMGNRVRLAYTVYIGEIPGQIARNSMDRDHDGELSKAESAVFGEELARQVAARLSFEVDGRRSPARWDEIHVGLGTPAANAGAFSVDLIRWACPGAGSDHSVVLYDRYEIDRPGETELKVEESPGVRVGRSSLGADGKPSRIDFKWAGGDSPLASLGYHLTYKVDESEAMMVGDGTCTEQASRPRRLWAYGAIAGGIALLTGVLLFRLNRRRSRAT